MSEGSVFKRKDGKYCAKYKGADGTWKYIYRKTKTEAKQALRAALKDRDEGKTPISKRNGVTVGEAIQMYMGEMDVSARTLQDRSYLVKNHLLPALAHKKVSTITPDAIRTFYRTPFPFPTYYPIRAPVLCAEYRTSSPSMGQPFVKQPLRHLTRLHCPRRARGCYKRRDSWADSRRGPKKKLMRSHARSRQNRPNAMLGHMKR